MIYITLEPQRIHIQNTEGCLVKEYGIIKEIKKTHYVVELFFTDESNERSNKVNYSFTRCFSKKTGEARGKHIPYKILP